ncbi:hypothetical protein JNM05_06345 [bacterium]|nr:hypothetical protein [bacterium]
MNRSQSSAKELEALKRVFKNPLMQALGLVLQRMRNFMVLSSDEVASKLGLGGSSYRMVEAGSAVLQPGKALLVIKSFERIELDPLCKIMVAIQVMESGIDSIDDMRAMSKLLGEADAELHDLFEKFDPLWPIIKSEESSVVGDEIKARHIDNELENFLTTPRPTVVDQEGLLDSHVKSLLSSTPPFYLDLSLDLLENLQGYVPRISPNELAKWEEKNRSRITHIVGTIRDHRMFTDNSNFDFFDHSFLWEGHFEKLQIMYLSPNRKDVLKEFTTNFKRFLEKNHKKYEQRLPRFDEAMKKIEIKWGFSKIKQFDEILLHESVDMNNLWFYKLRGGNVVAFADNAVMNAKEDRVHYGTSFTYNETVKKLKHIEKLWNEIDNK